MNWRLAGSLKTLLAQVNTLAPNRSRLSDGAVADAAHMQTGKSDHIPNRRGVVTALDITNDPANGCDANVITAALRTSANPRIKYVIFNRRIFSSKVSPWQWRPYTGENPHVKHFHISVIDDVSDDYPWNIDT